MVKINKVYTRTGDDGTTMIVGGHRIEKASELIGALGAIDELNAFIGHALVEISTSSALSELVAPTKRVQNELFHLGAELATPANERTSKTPKIRIQHTQRLESEIDHFNADLPDLTSFILPSGGEASARLHIARTVCRRAERTLLRIQGSTHFEEIEMTYLNRLSDWLFVAARWCAKQLNITEDLWDAKS